MGIANDLPAQCPEVVHMFLNGFGCQIRRYQAFQKGPETGHQFGCGSHSGQIFENLIEQAVEGYLKRGVCDAQDGD